MTTNHRVRFELIIGSLVLALGLFALPGLIYWVGTALLGPYGNDAGVAAFYGEFYGDLASGVVRAWALALGPLVLFGLVRLLFLKSSASAGGEEAKAHAAPPQARPPSQDHRRVEPRVSLD